MKKLLAVFVGIGVALAVTIPAMASADKMFVCKYVGQPGVNETLQTGQNPIEVSVNAIPGDGPVVPGYEFADQQGRSVVVATDSCGQETTPPPTPTETPTPPVGVPPVSTPCTGTATLGPWHGDPLINITLTGKGSFVVKGGKLRRTNLHIVRVTLTCGESQLIRRYHVLVGKTVSVYLDGVLVASATAPALG